MLTFRPTRLAFSLSQEHRQTVIDQCTAADPRHSPLWQATNKDLANQGKSLGEILKLVEAKLEAPQ